MTEINVFTKCLIIINIILLAIVIFLLPQMLKEINRLSSYNISQNVVLCGYIEDLQFQTGIDKKLSPNCQDDIKSNFQWLEK